LAFLCLPCSLEVNMSMTNGNPTRYWI